MRGGGEASNFKESNELWHVCKKVHEIKANIETKK